MDDTLAGLFIGGTVHDVAQVVGAGYSISPAAGDIATYIKLLRVALLLPIVMLIFISFKERAADKSAEVKTKFTHLVPSFLIVFFILALANNLGFISETIVGLIRTLSNWLLVVAIVAIGVRTSLKQIVSVGWKPVILLTCETFVLAGLVIIGIETLM